MAKYMVSSDIDRDRNNRECETFKTDSFEEAVKRYMYYCSLGYDTIFSDLENKKIIAQFMVASGASVSINPGA